MESPIWIFLLAIALTYTYAFVSGFTDAANAIATSIGSRVLTPVAAVLLAGLFNLVGGLTGTAVALTIAKGIVRVEDITLFTVVSGLAGAMTWSLFTYLYGIPVSETHGLIGGVIGATIATAGVEPIIWSGLNKVLVAIIASPLLGYTGGLVFISATMWICRNARRAAVEPVFFHLQRFSAMYMAFSHGRNDAQKPMGILALSLVLYSRAQEVSVPTWVVVSCAFLAALGTAYGGWRIIKTLGMKVTSLQPVHGFAAEVSGASVIELASILGIPISTTHAITSAIVGVGAAKNPSAVRWGVALDILLSWILTLPITVFLGWLYQHILRWIF
ncbi:MAG: anion permease [bacterium JZ-2024 1]